MTTLDMTTLDMTTLDLTTLDMTPATTHRTDGPLDDSTRDRR
jgi:hypothetical protein